MGYKWGAHEETIRAMYVDQQKSLDEVMAYFRTEHNFTPSRRAFQAQFRRWKFPTKYKRAWRDEAFCARVRELWQQNVRQKQMFEILQAEGHDVEMRHLVRARMRLGLRLRENGSAFGAGTLQEDDDDEDEDGGDTSSDDDEEEGGGEGEGTGMDRDEVLRRIEERRAAVEREQKELWAAKKRRRHTKPFAGLAADPPGPPRYPSEMTLTEAKAILQIEDVTMYRAIRERFDEMYVAEGGVRKAENQDRWRVLMDSLIRDNMHLRAVMWDPEGMDQKRLALDVICQDAAKRMRAMDSAMSMAEAQRVLGLDPAQGREARRILYTILAQVKFTSKSFEGRERWEEVKGRWLMEAEVLGRAVAQDGTDEEQKLRDKAVKVISKNVCSRYRNDVNKNGGAPPDISTIPAVQPPVKARVKPPLAKLVDQGGPPPARKTRNKPTSSQTHTQSRLLPPDDVSPLPSPASVSPMDGDDHTQDQLDPSLLDAQQQNPFLNDQYIQGVIQAATQATSPAPPIFNHHHQHHHQQPLPPAPAPAPILAPIPSGFPPTAVYFRLHPTSSVAAPALWISTLTVPSVAELRARAIDKVPGALCVGVEGIIKDPGGGDTTLPLPVNDDGELGAYLEHVRGVMAPTFSVTLVDGGRGGGWV